MRSNRSIIMDEAATYLGQQQHAAMLTGLRIRQCEIFERGEPLADFMDILNSRGGMTLIPADQINELCKQLNTMNEVAA
jgi:hypothetical protein